MYRSYQSDALSGNTQLFGTSWDRFNTYRVEWQLPASDPAGLGYLRWFFNDRKVYGVRGETLRKKTGSKVRGLMSCSNRASWQSFFLAGLACSPRSSPSSAPSLPATT